MKRRKEYTFKKPLDWNQMVDNYLLGLAHSDADSNLRLAARLIDNLYPEALKWKSGRIQLIRNLVRNIWIDVKYEL